MKNILSKLSIISICIFGCYSESDMEAETETTSNDTEEIENRASTSCITENGHWGEWGKEKNCKMYTDSGGNLIKECKTVNVCKELASYPHPCSGICPQ